MNQPQTEFDTPWKDILQQYFEDFILFFFPQAHQEIDWSRGFEFLDKELQQIVRDAELGRRLVDKLVKIYRLDGTEAWVLIHVEVQSQEESNFAERMFVYNYRIYDRYQRSVASLVVLGDDRSGWRPHQFGYRLFGCEVQFRFPVAKLLDYDRRWSELEASRNPFAIVVMTHLKALETRSNRNDRKKWKLTLTKRLYEQGYDRQDIINLFSFIDWMMTLSDELQQQFEQELSEYEENQNMPYVSNFERRAIQRGLEQGIQQGLEQSKAQIRQTLLESIELGLELKFGTIGLNLLPEIYPIEDVERLRAIQRGLKTATTVEELRQIYQPTTSD